jgi:hypothetical protein
MSLEEKIALIVADVSMRVDDYLRVKELREMTVAETVRRTGLDRNFVRKCRAIFEPNKF